MLTGVFPWDIPSVDDARCVQACRGATAIQAMVAHWGLPAMDPQATDLLSKMFCSPDTRCDTAAIVSHPFVTAITGVHTKLIKQSLATADFAAMEETVSIVLPSRKVDTLSVNKQPLQLHTPVKKNLNKPDAPSTLTYDSHFISPCVSRSVSYNSGSPMSAGYSSTSHHSTGSNSSASAFSPVSSALNTPSSSHDSSLMQAHAGRSKRRITPSQTHDISRLILQPMALA